MARCPFYHEHRKLLLSDEIGSRQTSTVVIPYCEHTHSPARREIVLSVIGGANHLKCGGDLARCQVPAEKR